MQPYAEKFHEMKRFVRFGERDEQLLSELRDHARPAFAAIATEFYERSREHEQAHAVFQNEAQIARLHASLVAWMERVLSGPYDDAYCAKSIEIGRVHVRVGLPQRFMFSAMALVRVRLTRIALEAMDRRGSDACESLARILDIELGLMNETYLEAIVERAQRLERAHRELATRTLAQAERRYVRAVELAGAIIVGLDSKGAIQLFNRKAEGVSGYRADEVRGQSFAELFVVDREGWAAAWRQVESDESEAPIAVTLQLRNRRHHEHELKAQLSRTRDEHEPDAMFILVAQDVTGERALAARLRQSERLAALGTLAAGLAHEIRNPLNGAQLHLTFLKRALAGAEVDRDIGEAVEVVSGEIKRLSTLVSEFLDFARPARLSCKPTDVAQLAQHAMSMVSGRGGDLTLAVETPHSTLLADVDAEKLEQVLLNLLANAIEAAGAGGGSHVTLRAYRSPREAIVEVEDDGPGLPSPDAPIFDAFYSTKPGGTGLGLAIAHRIVTDHEGSIEVESAPGRTLFRIRLPMSRTAGD